MNLVVDDAVEVKLATKTDEEKRRPLGMWQLPSIYHLRLPMLMSCFEYRSNTAQGRQCLPHPSGPVIASHTSSPI